MITTGHVGIGVRDARPEDATALVDVFRESWRHAYCGIIPALHLLGLMSRRDAAWWRTSIRSEPHFLVLEAGGRVAGYATFGPVRGRNRAGAEIYELYLDPVHQGLGLGQHLFEACRQRLDAEGRNGLVVWALADNAAACEFYRRCGGRPAGSASEYFSGKKLNKIGFVWS